MQTQIQQSSKKNKVTVPFYSPPSRLYGQTPAEIIKEARAAVLSTSPTGIKPVFTSRPFTPKEKERTLFGNVKKRSGRPPSSFSLKNHQSQELGLGVKLPSIEVVSRKKLLSTFHYSNNLSLDNLTEDYDAEVLEEIGEIDSNLPKWKKSHSCPKEGRMVKAASYNELSYKIYTQNNNNWEEASGKHENKYKRINNSDGEDTGSSLTYENSTKTEQPELQSSDEYRYLNMIRGGGDYELVKKTQDFSKAENNSPETQDFEHLKEAPKVEVKEVKQTRSEPEQKSISNGQSDGNDTSKVSVIHSQDSNKEKSTKKGNQKAEEINKSKFQEKVSEKSTVTEHKSEYLISLTKENKVSSPAKQYLDVPTEILQLYETARYYGVDVNETSHAKGSTNDRPSSVKNADDYFGEKQNDFLNQLKENFNKVDEKVKYLNETLEKSQRKSPQKADTKTQEKHTNDSDKVQFVMNNKKRYHVVSSKSDVKEKAYKKWNSKQQEHYSTTEESSSHGGWDLFWKNSYFRSKDEEEVNSQGSEDSQKATTDEEYIQRLVNKLTKISKLGTDKQTICDTVSQLYNFLKRNKTVLNDKLKSVLLKALYTYVDDECPEILLNLARILLYLKVESVLPVAFKMVFKVARSDANDGLFLNEEDVLELFLEGIGRASPLDNAESCIYGYGALKFLTMNYNILSRILNMGALDLMTLHLKMINSAHIDKGNVEEQTQHALFQLTGALRHVAAGEGALPLFLTTNCITIMCRTLQLFHKDDDVVTNISRTLSLLSTDEGVIQTLMSVENILISIIELIERYKENDKILIRLSYCLGNIVEHSDLARVQISRNETSLNILLNTLKLYISKDLEISMTDNNLNTEELSSDIIDDVIVKIIRIIANMSMNPIVGSNLSPTTNEKNSVQLSKLLSVLLMRKDPGITLLATLGCLNNISYYCNTHSVLIDITQGIQRVLGLPSEDCQAEAARVLGNLTRHKEIRDLIYNTGGVNNLIKLLTSENQEVVRCACGALVNMMLDPETRKQFVEVHGIDKLVKSLELFTGDWPLASLATRAIWNSCADDLSSAMAHNNIEHLLNILANSLEEENWNDGDPVWEEFASIATDLLERINTHLEST